MDRFGAKYNLGRSVAWHFLAEFRVSTVPRRYLAHHEPDSQQNEKSLFAQNIDVNVNKII